MGQSHSTVLKNTARTVACSLTNAERRGLDTFVDRIVTAGYADRNDGWSLGENLARGTGNLGTARGVPAAWMKSSGHLAGSDNPSSRRETLR